MSEVAERSERVAPGSPRFIPAARVLLYWTLLSTLYFFPACVLPVGPDFQDPPPVQNYPPSFSSDQPNPLPLTTVNIAPPPAMNVFTINVEDPNPQDTLSVRWVTDYPPYNALSSLLQQESNIPAVTNQSAQNVQFSSKNITCADFRPGGGTRLVVIVSDRGFLPPDDAAAMSADYRFNFDANGEKTFLMTSWNITGITTPCP